LACLDSKAGVYTLCYTQVRSALTLRFMHRKALRLRAPGMQTLVDMAEKHSTEESHRLLLAADSVAEDFSVAGWLEREGFDVMTAADGQEALQIVCSSWQPDVVLLDLTLPGMNGSSLYKQVRTKNRTAVILVLGDESEEDEVQSLEAGADDYVAKRFSPDVLLARVRAHLRSRRAAGNQRILQPGDLWLDAKNYATRVKGEWVDLRPQEFRLLIALAQSSGVPVSRRELIRRAGATWRGASSRTVDMNISRIRACVESPSDYTYIHSIRGVGYRFEPIPKETSSQASSKKRSV
jgi:DNA-binding response OmpR family regulator